ncbi:unnamed protein product [Symbiodinium natans]|uniref:NHR domain-containing protein n=1 Tax=Symbiodinium natans TaxID=878477 RepID=A0A812L767_9DINO|nr:unnamed protein product [Symbiodinium natans]
MNAADPIAHTGSGHAFVEIGRRTASAVHFVLILTGSLVLIQSFHTLTFFHQQGQWASLRDMARTSWQSYLLVLKFFLAPFLEAGFLDAWLPSQVDFDTWAVFVPGIMSLFLCFTASLGFSVMRRPGLPSRTLAYAVCAAVLLVSQVELVQALAEFSTWEEVPLAAAEEQKVEMQRQLFKASHASFVSMLDYKQCPMESADIVRCTLEKRVLPVVVAKEFCQPLDLPGRSSHKRVQACQKSAKALSMWSSPRERDELYCRCWSAAFDAILSLLEWAMLSWFICLLGVLLAIYTSIRPKLLSQGPAAHKEVLGCVGLSAAAIIWKVFLGVEDSRLGGREREKGNLETWGSKGRIGFLLMAATMGRMGRMGSEMALGSRFTFRIPRAVSTGCLTCLVESESNLISGLQGLGFHRRASSESLVLSGHSQATASRKGVPRGIAIARAPCPVRGSSTTLGWAFSLLIADVDSGLSSGLWVGLTMTSPDSLALRPDVDFAADVPDSVVAGGEGTLWDGSECQYISWDTSQLQVGDQVHVFLSAAGEFQVRVNGKSVAGCQVWLPLRGPFYPLVELRGSTKAVELVRESLGSAAEEPRPVPQAMPEVCQPGCEQDGNTSQQPGRRARSATPSRRSRTTLEPKVEDGQHEDPRLWATVRDCLARPQNYDQVFHAVCALLCEARARSEMACSSAWVRRSAPACSVRPRPSAARRSSGACAKS